MQTADEPRLRALSRRIQAGNCVLALGPGASTYRPDSREAPLTVLLAEELSADPRLSSVPGLNCEDLRHVAQALLEKEPDSSLLQDQVVEFYKRFSGRTTGFHENIAALPFRLCVTTTPDDFLYTAFLQAGKSPIRHFYNFRRSHPLPTLEASVQRPLIYHLYGYSSEPDSLVLTENDLIDFLVRVVRNEPPLPAFIRATLCKAETTCLFVDLGFKNWYLRVLLQALQLYGHSDMSVALEQAEFFAQSLQHQTTVYFSGPKTMSIHFRQDSLAEFAANLRTAYTTVYPETGQPEPQQPPSGAPCVFLSYASEDRPVVDHLAERLEFRGLAVWQDHKRLRAGDNWERALMYVLNKQVDYVVVVQTPAMTGRVEGVFYTEIGEALKRQKGMRAGARFVFPVRHGIGTVLPELKDLHSISVDTEEGVEALALSINEDWQRRSMSAAGAFS